MEVSSRLSVSNPHDYMAQASFSTGSRSRLLLVGVGLTSLGNTRYSSRIKQIYPAALFR